MKDPNKISSRRRLKGLTAVIGVAVLAVLTAWYLWEPRHGGKPLSHWLKRCVTADLRASSTWLEERRPCPDDVRMAIRAMGPKMAPVLLRRVGHPPPYERIYPWLPVEMQCFIPKPDSGYLLRNRVASAVSLLGSSAVPQLTTALQSPNTEVQLVALRSLAFMGLEADPAALAVANLLQSSDGHVRLAAVKTLKRMGPNRRAAIPALVNALQDTSNSEDFLIDAVQVLGELGPEAHVAVLELNDLFQGTAPAGLFGQPGVMPPLGAIQAALGRPNDLARVQEQAAIALCRIAADTNAMSFLLAKLERCRTELQHLPPPVRWGHLPSQDAPPEEDSKTASPETQTPADSDTGQNPDGNMVRFGLFSSGNEAFPACLRILRGLAEIGPSAKAAVPLVRELAQHPVLDPTIQEVKPLLIRAALETLRRIDSEAAINTGEAAKPQ
jgi:hypothetical protein